MYKLLIVEPFEFGTINNIEQSVIDIKKGVNNNWLIILETVINFTGIQSKYLLIKTKKEYYHINLQEQLFKTLILEMAMIPGLNEKNFSEHDLKNYRGNFLTGELVCN